jgi:hypothetical protein
LHDPPDMAVVGQPLPYKRVKKPSCATWPCRHRSYTNREPKHLGTRLHRWNHAKPAPSHDPPSDYLVGCNCCLQLTNARHHKGVATAELHKGVATAELLLSNRGRLPMSAASAHFSLFSMASERRRSKERRHAMAEAFVARSGPRFGALRFLLPAGYENLAAQ